MIPTVHIYISIYHILLVNCVSVLYFTKYLHIVCLNITSLSIVTWFELEIGNLLIKTKEKKKHDHHQRPPPTN